MADIDYNERVPNRDLIKTAKKEEMRFLAILIRDKHCLADAISSGILTGLKGHFWDEEARFLFEIIHEYYNKYKTVLTRTAIDSIMDSISKIGNKTISESDRASARLIYDKAFSTEHSVEDYDLLKDNINKRYVQWQSYLVLAEKLPEILNATNGQDKIIEDLKTKISGIEGMNSDSYTLTLGMKDGFSKAFDYVTERREHPEIKKAFLTGISALDNLYFGIEPGTYNIISGAINGGKTTLMFNIAFNMSKMGISVVYITIEKAAIPIYTRLLCLHSLVDYNRVKAGGKSEKGLNDYYYGKIVDAKNDLLKNIIPNLEIIQSSQTVKASKLISEIEKIRNRKHVDVVIIDYLGVVGHDTFHPNRPDLDEAITSRTFQNYGKVKNIAMLTAVQWKTASQKEIRGKNKKAMSNESSVVEINPEDHAGSNMIIADADMVWAIALSSESPPTRATVFGAKARDAASRIPVQLSFDGKIGKISDLPFEIGQVKSVDDIIYNKDMTEEKLKEDDGLFSDHDSLGIKEDSDILEIDDEMDKISSNEDSKEIVTPKKEDVESKSEKTSKSIADDILDW